MPMILPTAPRWVYAPVHAARAAGRPIDVAAENTAFLARLPARQERRPDAPLVVVPGYTPVGTDVPVRLHDTARERLANAVRALADHRAVGVLVTGGNVHPADTPWNEAWEMRRHLLDLGVAADRVVLEPYARHSTTNLRNAGRFLRAYAIPAAVVVTDAGQGFYFGAQDISSFRLRCEIELGYAVGDLAPDGALTRVMFVPSPEVERWGRDPLDP